VKAHLDVISHDAGPTFTVYKWLYWPVVLSDLGRIPYLCYFSVLLLNVTVWAGVGVNSSAEVQLTGFCQSPSLDRLEELTERGMGRESCRALSEDDSSEVDSEPNNMGWQYQQ